MYRGRGRGRGGRKPRGDADAFKQDRAQSTDADAEPVEEAATQDEAAATRRTLADEGEFAESIKVAGGSRVTGLAGAVSHRIRASLQPTLLAAGNASINQAVKALAVARKYLAGDSTDVCYVPLFRCEDHGRALLALEVRVHTAGVAPPKLANGDGEEQVVQLKVSARSRHAKVGGAIAARVRESNSVQLLALGVDAVANAVMATCHARFYLGADGIDMRVLPEFVTVQREGRELNAMQLTVLV